MTTDSGLTALPPWLQPLAELLGGMLQREQLPQALLIHGVPGTGRRVLGLWVAARLLGIALDRLRGPADIDRAGEPVPPPGHPDFVLVEPEPEKATIAIEQVRELIDVLHLKSHQGGARVALVWPAECLTPQAANSLLKTLEEPPAGGTIILIAESLSRLPPTIISRCHRLRVHPPAREPAVAWLSRQAAEADWAELLDFAGGAPLLALGLHQGGFTRQAAQYARDLSALGDGKATPAEVATRWAGNDPELALRWLYWRTGEAIRAAMAPSGTGVSRTTTLQMPANPPKIPQLFAQLREIEYLRRNQTRALRPELQLNAMLLLWYGQRAYGKGEG